MPCSDITEILRLTLDAEERLVSYGLSKRSCGRAVGAESLILEWVSGRGAGELLTASVDEFLDAHPCSDETEEFLYLKHFFALREGLNVLLGHEPGGAASPCAVESIGYGPEGTDLIAQLKIDAFTDQIKSCGRCGKGCGARKAS